MPVRDEEDEYGDQGSCTRDREYDSYKASKHESRPEEKSSYFEPQHTETKREPDYDDRMTGILLTEEELAAEEAAQAKDEGKGKAKAK